MTEERLIEIFSNHGFELLTLDAKYIKAVKQAVNETIDEAVEHTDHFDHIHKSDILNLKVK